MNKIKKVTILLISILILTINDKVNAVVEVSGNWSSFGKDNPCKSYGGYTACYIPKFEFRVTLVKNNGEKVAGTKSIEYGYSTDNKTKLVNFTNSQKQNFVNGDKFGYKYSAEYNDYNPISTHTYYQVYMVNNYLKYKNASTGRDDPDKYSAFTNELKQGIHSKAKRYGIDPGTSGTYDFLTMFLYHCGFLNKNESGGVYYSIDDETNEYIIRKRQTISNSDYYLLIEPLYTIFYNESSSDPLTYKYGTTTEIGQFLYDKTKTTEGTEKMSNGYMAGLSLIFTYNAGSNLNTQPNESIKTFRSGRFRSYDSQDLNAYNIEAPEPCPLTSNCEATKTCHRFCDRNERKGKWAELANTDYGYGATILRLSAEFKEPENDYHTMTLDLCGKEVTKETNDGIIEFKAPFSLGLNDGDIFTYEEVKFAKSVDANNEIYCYDDFTYNFSEILNKLDSYKKGSFKPSTQIARTPGKLTINRYCYVQNWSNYETSFTENFSMYTNQKIPLKLFDKMIYLSPTKKNNTDIIIKQDNKDYRFLVKPAFGSAAVIEIDAEIEFSYDWETFTIPSSLDITKTYPASVNLTNASYGYSTNLIKEFSNNSKSFTKIGKGGIPITHNINLEYTDANSNGTGEDKICSTVSWLDTTEDQIKFRTIALDNPFPARDASSRMPGSNWLGINNYVRGYITYNRGVTGEEVYDKDPIYTINLNPSTMIKIREYNKKHNYGDIDLNCSGENNTECMSEFLRDTSIFKSDSVTGSCMITSNTYKDITNGVTGEQFREKMANITGRTESFKQESSYDSKYDFNHDKRINDNDVEIFTYAEKTTPYYTCADKTFENSGYLGRSEN